MNDPRNQARKRGEKLADELVEFIRRECAEEHVANVLLGASDAMARHTASLRNPTGRPFPIPGKEGGEPTPEDSPDYN